MKNKKPKIKIRIPHAIYHDMLEDLRRSHPFAFERVGFISTNSKKLKSNTIIITVTGFQSVDDHDYMEDGSVGARINSTAIRKAMQMVLDKESGCFHVHLHDHKDTPSPSLTDKKGLPGVIDSFSNVSSEPHGIMILSDDSFYVAVKLAGVTQYIIPEVISVVGYPMKFVFPGKKFLKKNKLYDRQSFLGPYSQFFFENVTVGIIGFGGGGSHFGQQLAHLGVRNIVVFDGDKIEDTNHNRLVGGWFSDIKRGLSKTSIAKRMIKKIFPAAKVQCIDDIWQNHPELLQECDIIVSGVDTYIGRHDLEAECRRFVIPMIDIGMDVHTVEGYASHMSGQVILSMPGMPCMRCLGFITDEKLKLEAAKYGHVGGRPQVIWSNGVLASSAIGVFVDLITGWTGQKDRVVYLSYDGNLQLMSVHVRAQFAPGICLHYPLDQTGPPKFRRL